MTFSAKTHNDECDVCGRPVVEENPACPQHRVWKLEAEVAQLQQTCDEFRSASLLVGVAGDAEGVQPHHVESHISELRAEVERLHASLEKMADGVAAVPGTNVFYIHPNSGTIYERTYDVELSDPHSYRDEDNQVVWVPISECFSTRAAAETAREANAND